MTLKISTLFFALSFSNISFAEDTLTVAVAGAAVNKWTQAGVRVTDKPFDLGIQGNGFFVLQANESEELVFSRYGEMSLDTEGFLIHTASQNKVLGFCKGELEPINLSSFAKDSAGSVVKTFRVELDGSITGVYESGNSYKTCTVALALFNNALKLARTKHLLKPTRLSGEAFIGKPQTDSRGGIYGSSLEELDEHIYGLNAQLQDLDRVALEMEKEKKVVEHWNKERTAFYIYDLHVTKEELSQIEKSLEKCQAAVKKAVDKVVQMQIPSHIPDEEFEARIKSALGQNESEVLEILGPDRLKKAKDFRKSFDWASWQRFGSGLGYDTAF